jgi:small GTP-binding protein
LAILFIVSKLFDAVVHENILMLGSEPLAHKIVIIGESDVGKTSIIRCFDEQTFVSSQNPTVGACFLSKTLTVNDYPVVLNIWDTAGQERYRSLVPTYAHGARAAILCYDCTSPASFDALDTWLETLHRFCATDFALFLCGNKIDLPETVPQAHAKQWAADHNAQYKMTSAKDGVGVTELFRAIAEALSRMGQFSVDALTISGRNRVCC